MKRFFILASAAIVALASCAKTQVVYNDQPEEIAFKQITGAMTKDATVGDNNATQMKVWAYYNANQADYFASTGVIFSASDASNWVADPPQYWPLSGSLDFVYCAPVILNCDSSYGELTAELDNSQDFMYGKNVLNASKQNTALPAPLRHALARVDVSITSDLDGLVITSVKLLDPNTSGNLVVDYEETDDPLTPKDERLTWSALNTEDVQYSTLARETTKDQTYSEYKYVLPGDQKTLELKYKLTSDTPELTYEHPLTGKWYDGHKYTYAINIRANEIKFNPSVDEWTVEAVSNIETDPNQAN